MRGSRYDNANVHIGGSFGAFRDPCALHVKDRAVGAAAERGRCCPGRVTVSGLNAPPPALNPFPQQRLNMHLCRL